MVKVGNQWTVLGLVSVAAKKECIENNLVLFTQVPIFMKWINDIIDECTKSKYGPGMNVGGENSYPGQWPWLAPIFYEGKYQGGSSLISKKHLLSGNLRKDGTTQIFYKSFLI